MKCYDKTAALRVYTWDYCPKPKEYDRGCVRDKNALLEVYLCDRCHEYNRSSTTIGGHDWWDAIDSFDKPPTASELPELIARQKAALEDDTSQLSEQEEILAHQEEILAQQEEIVARQEAEVESARFWLSEQKALLARLEKLKGF